VGSCRLLERLAVEAPAALAACLPDVVPRVSECMVDAKDQVKVRGGPAWWVGCIGAELRPVLCACMSAAGALPRGAGERCRAARTERCCRAAGCGLAR
jgi:hypothetical protein